MLRPFNWCHDRRVQRVLRYSRYRFFLLERLVLFGKMLLGRVLIYPFRKLMFGEFHWSTTIGSNCEFRQTKNIFLAPHVVLNQGVVIHAGVETGVHIGEHSQLNPYSVLYGDIRIGRWVMIAPHVMLAGGNHQYSRLDIPIMNQGSTSKGGITIDQDVWIGANSVITDGVHVARGAIIAAGAVVTSDVESHSIVAGVPAKIIRRRKIQ
jgi:galactoside O-acetyltransferase